MLKSEIRVLISCKFELFFVILQLDYSALVALKTKSNVNTNRQINTIKITNKLIYEKTLFVCIPFVLRPRVLFEGLFGARGRIAIMAWREYLQRASAT
jgi:hypothetical protein